MTEKRNSKSKYTYTHETNKSVDIHHVTLRKNGVRRRIVVFAALGLLFNVCYFLLGQCGSLSVLIMYFGIGVIFIRLLRRKLVLRESVVIIPGFGVQLETHYRSGRAVRHFIPFDKILKPVLNECVTPVTCYWSLALILREEDHLMLVFKELQPPLKTLLPVWKALCEATETRASPMPSDES